MISFTNQTSSSYVQKQGGLVFHLEVCLKQYLKRPFILLLSEDHLDHLKYHYGGVAIGVLARVEDYNCIPVPE